MVLKSNQRNLFKDVVLMGTLAELGNSPACFSAPDEQKFCFLTLHHSTALEIIANMRLPEFLLLKELELLGRKESFCIKANNLA